MAAYNFERLVDDTHTVQLPPEVPKGWAEFSVVPKEVPEQRRANYYKMLDEILAEPAANPMTIEQILKYVRAERDSWE